MRRWKLCSAMLVVALAASLSFSADVFACWPQPGELEKIVSFDPDAIETPESVAVDFFGNKYISLSLTGEIRKIAPNGTQSTLAVLPIGEPLTPCYGFMAIMGALAIDHMGTLYIPVDSCDLENRGIWKVTQSGQTTLLANMPGEALVNGIALRLGQLYIADSAMGVIWRLPVTGGEPEIWLDDPLFKPDPNIPPPEGGGIIPAINGLQFYLGELYVANSSTNQILAVPLEYSGVPGKPNPGVVRVHATVAHGLDDFAFDIMGNLYGTTDLYNTVVKVAPDGSEEVLFTVDDGLDGPSATVFGKGFDSLDLYITNAAFPFFSTTHQPSLMKVRLGIPGYPGR